MSTQPRFGIRRSLAASTLFLAIISAALCCAVRAQSAGPTIADQSWANVTILGNRAAAPVVGAEPRTAENIRADQKAKADRFRTLAKAAKEFLAQYPTHAKAGEAKKLEVLAALEGITADDPVFRSEALRTASAYRIDKTNAAADRFEVASAMERGELSRRLGGAAWYGNALEAEMLGDRLRKEFGELPQIYGFYLSVAENGSCFNSGDVATKILQMAPSPSVRASAQRVLERWRMIGQPFDLPLKRTDGTATALGALAGKRTVLVVYSSERHPDGPPGLGGFKRAAPVGVNWVYLALGPVPATTPRQAAVGTTCVESLGLKSPVVRQLGISRLPAVYILDEKKALFGFGRVDDLPWLLAQSNPALRDHSAP